MFKRSSWLHLRLPFSWFLLPVFLFSLSVSPNFNGARMGWVLFIVHFLLYPASNGYNSYFDKDKKSIGALRNPPPVYPGLYYLSLFLDLAAVILGYAFVSPTFAAMLLIYGLVSKAYSHPRIRLKKYAVSSWLIAGFFQGIFTFVMCYCGVNDFSIITALNEDVLLAGALTTVMLWANYPMTQVYQHEEDTERGDKTLSIVLGIKGTFLFAAFIFLLATIGFYLYLREFFGMRNGIIFLLSTIPVLLYFSFWFLAARKDSSAANYSRTMGLNVISSTCLNGFFTYLFLSKTHLLQLLV